MKKKILLIVCVLLLNASSFETLAQVKHNSFFYGVDLHSSNFWTNQVVALPLIVLSAFDITAPVSTGIDVNFISVKNNGEKVKIDDGNVFGFKAFDLFDNINAGMKFGWQSLDFPIGIFAKGYYRFNRFRTMFPNETKYTQHKIQSIIPGIGLRITPKLGGYSHAYYPVAEIALNYEYNFAYKGAFGNNLSQLNNGLSSSYSVGVGTADIQTMLGVDIQHYNIFNKNFSSDGGITHPYASTKTNSVSLYFSVSMLIK